MNIDTTVAEAKTSHKPQVFIKNITFNDGTSLRPERNSIVVFTGANNSGKSQVLRDIKLHLGSASYDSIIVINDIEYDYLGTFDDEVFFEEHFYPDQLGDYRSYDTDRFFEKRYLHEMWNDRKFHSGFHLLFVKLLDAETRLVSSNALTRNDHPEQHPIFKLIKSDTLAQKISDYFRQAFGVDLVPSDGDMQTVPLHVGQAPDKAQFTMDRRDIYYKEVDSLPKLQEQGDGMRSFASILLDTFTSDHTITLIDEPDAFLHPPQSRLLGKMLAKNNPENRQLLISTHSEVFLQGLLDADNENVTVIRINRDNNINEMSVLENHEIKKLWGNPLLRYSNILSGLFHEKVIVCESDYDCLFYQAVMDAIYESESEVAPDVLFTHCGGKSRIKEVVSALKAVNVPVVAVCDFDVLDDKKVFKPLVEAFGLDWETDFAPHMKTIYDYINGKNQDAGNVRKDLKRKGKHSFDGNEYVAYEKVESLCNSAGLFIVPEGEMECFDKSVVKNKKEWVYKVLESGDLANQPALEKARRFVQAFLDCKCAAN